jgi:beta-glucosidase
VAGKNADDLGNQCGGWTIGWQGKSGQPTTGGTTILVALKGVVPKNTKVTFSLDGSGAEGASAGVAVIGEKPYAEMTGDRNDLSLAKEDVDAVRNIKKAGIPVVAVLISGRPLILEPILEQADAIVAAWLPGTEGQGVADVLLGNYKPTGKLSFAWPRSMSQLPHKQGEPLAGPLYPFGYGLKY